MKIDAAERAAVAERAIGRIETWRINAMPSNLASRHTAAALWVAGLLRLDLPQGITEADPQAVIYLEQLLEQVAGVVFRRCGLEEIAALLRGYRARLMVQWEYPSDGDTKQIACIDAILTKLGGKTDAK